jgi:hypothetical protein
VRRHRQVIDAHVPDGEDDQNVARAIDAIRSAQTVKEQGKLVAAAMQAQWMVLARYARGNRDRLEVNKRHMRRVLVVLGAVLLGLGALEQHFQATRHADTLAAESRGFFYSAKAGCLRSNQRRRRAEAKLTAHHDPAAAAFAEPILAALAPHHANCGAYAIAQVRQLKLNVSIAELERAVGIKHRAR